MRTFGNNNVMTVLAVGNKEKLHSALGKTLNRSRIKTEWSGTGTDALERIEKAPADLLLIEERLPDMDARQFVEKMVMVDPFIQCAVLGTLEEKAFHDRFEGLGVLMQLPAVPGQQDVDQLLEKFNTIKRAEGVQE